MIFEDSQTCFKGKFSASFLYNPLLQFVSLIIIHFFPPNHQQETTLKGEGAARERNIKITCGTSSLLSSVFTVQCSEDLS